MTWQKGKEHNLIWTIKSMISLANDSLTSYYFAFWLLYQKQFTHSDSISYTGHSLWKTPSNKLQKNPAWSFSIFKLILKTNVYTMRKWECNDLSLHSSKKRNNHWAKMSLRHRCQQFPGFFRVYARRGAWELIKTIHVDIYQSQEADSFEKCNVWNSWHGICFIPNSDIR